MGSDRKLRRRVRGALFGSLAGAEEVHSFSSVTFLSRWLRRRYRDDRYGEDVDRIHALPGLQRRFLDVKPWMKRAAAHTRFHLYYAEPFRLDRIHAERLRRVPRTTLYPRQGRGHAVILEFARSGELREILRTAIESSRTKGAPNTRT